MLRHRNRFTDQHMQEELISQKYSALGVHDRICEFPVVWWIVRSTRMIDRKCILLYVDVNINSRGIKSALTRSVNEDEKYSTLIAMEPTGQIRIIRYTRLVTEKVRFQITLTSSSIL